jgi:hypothetical protein
MRHFRIVYEQSLNIDEHNQVTEVRPWTRIELGFDAIQTGWFGGFGPNWIDLAVLQVIGLHARPLQGEDFNLLRDLGLVGPDDLNRLYARITDEAVADILGCDRKWAGKCASRLDGKGLLRVLSLPKQFRDSRGQFSGNDAYLLAGQVLVQSDVDRGYSVPTAGFDRGYSIPTVGRISGHNDARRGYSVPTKYINKLSTLSNGESGSRGDPAAESSASGTVLASDSENAGDLPTLDLSDNATGTDRAGRAALAASSEANRSRGTIWQRLDAALGDDKTATAFEAVLAEIESTLGFNDIGLRAARRAFEPLPERRRRVLDDLRRMHGNQSLKPHVRQRNVVGILTQNIGITLGLGLQANGSLRVLADRDDYTVIGGLVKEFGAELVWNVACVIAGQGFEGDPVEYLRGALRTKRERDKAGPSASGRPRGPSGLGSFDDIDYTKEEVG